ncbi:hypothetical protein [Flavobacterium notoginsengisoli]|uniref:hypothetical protein n=1 Tax=Flavobacterium notoginsengisoli TaxID=1478199 RepID=UPI00362BDB0D
MSPIRNIWNEANVDFNKGENVTPVDILRKQSDALNKDTDKTNIYSMIMSFSIKKNNVVDKVKHVLYIFPKNGNDYNYKLIEISSNPENDYPLQVYAYQSGNINFGKCKTEEEFYETLSKIFTDPRLKIVFEQLRNIGDTIESFKQEE